MPDSSVALVAVKIIDWIHFMEGPHDSVPIHLGKDRGSRDAATDLVTLFEACLSDGDGHRLDPINKKELRSRVKGIYRTCHGLERGIQNIGVINITPRNNTNSRS